mmetsp:Transcript_17389/g.20471  ORF Transcript_17389/g.20471 Transcript_17389/m.20471 type:complete len:183 (+) Transcript_17389:61-609(+)
MSAALSVQNEMKMDVTTALTLVIPEEFHDHINIIRQQYDKAFPRWMPHINFLFPFVGEEHFESIQEHLQTNLENFGPLELTFNKITFFKQKKMNTYNLQPTHDNRLQDLFCIIRETLPTIQVKHAEFHPHMTLGQAKTSSHTEFMNELEAWLGDGFTINVDHICLIKRINNDPFEIKFKVQL